MDYSQYEDQKIVLDFFESKRNGFVVDVGAADGVRYSNSRYLIAHLNWSGLLVEPHPFFHKQLIDLYSENPNVKILNTAVSDFAGECDFYCYGADEHSQVSTISAEFRDRVCVAHGDRYDPEPIRTSVVKLSEILAIAPSVDFLSIDCEGVDMLVIQSNDWKRFRPRLVCVEHSMEMSVLDQFMALHSYRAVAKTAGNSFFVDVFPCSSDEGIRKE